MSKSSKSKTETANWERIRTAITLAIKATS